MMFISSRRFWVRSTVAVCFAAALLLGSQAFATDATSTTAPPHAHHHGAPPSTGNAALDAAMKACAESVAKDAHGGPDHTAMDACLKAKGFTPPAGGPPHEGAGGPPPDGASEPSSSK